MQVLLNVKEVIISIKPAKSAQKCKPSEDSVRSKSEHIYMVIFSLRD